MKELLKTTTNYVPFYSVNEEGTLTYLSIEKGKIYKNVISSEEMHVGIQKKGNIKTGDEWLLNTLPGEHEISVKGKPITDMKGSCQGCCDGCEGFCYAINGNRTHHNAVMPSTMKNLIIYRHDPKRYEAEIKDELKKWKVAEGESKVFRWHASGEIEDYRYLEMMIRIASEFSDVKFYTYTKRFEYIRDFLDAYGDFPENFVVNLSVWENNLIEAGFPTKYLDKVQRFEWKDKMSVEEYNKSIHCRSVIHLVEGEKKGHLNHDMNCKKCGLCWRGKCKGRTIFVYNH